MDSTSGTSLIEWAGLFFIGATAVATGITAFVLLQQWRGDVEVEWEPSWDDKYPKSIPPTLRCRITVRNNRHFGVRGLVAEVTRCPVKDVRFSDYDKHESWAKHQAPIIFDADPGQSKVFTVFVSPDWESLAERRAVKKRPTSSTSLRIQISVASKSRNRTKIKRHTKIPIPHAMIIRAAKAVRK